MSSANEIEDNQYLCRLIDDAGLRIFHALSGGHCCNSMRVVFFEAVNTGPTTENIFTFPINATRFSRMLQSSASDVFDIR